MVRACVYVPGREDKDHPHISDGELVFLAGVPLIPSNPIASEQEIMEEEEGIEVDEYSESGSGGSAGSSCCSSSSSGQEEDEVMDMLVSPDDEDHDDDDGDDEMEEEEDDDDDDIDKTEENLSLIHI